MKKMKRFASLLLAIVMLLTSAVFALSVSAEEELPAVEVTDADWLRVEKLEAFDAITNEYEDIGMYVTRRQMVDIIAKYLRMQVEGTATGKSPFLDVAKNDISFDGIVALCNAGIITGDNEYKFYPDNYLTYDEAIVFVVNAVGYKLYATREGGFPTGYHRIAIKSGMLDGLKFNSGKEYIPLCDVYKMLESALDVGAVVPTVYANGEVEYQISNAETFLSDTYGIVKYRGIVTGTEDTRLTKADSDMTDEQVEINGVVYDTPGYVYATSLGRAVYYYTRKTDNGTYDAAYVEEDNKRNHLEKVYSENLLIPKTTDNSRIYYTDENNKEQHLNLNDNVDVIYNGKCYRGYGYIQDILPAYGYIEALDNTGDEVYDVLFVYAYKTVVVGAVDTYNESVISMFKNDEDVYEEIDLSGRKDKINIREMPYYTSMKLENLKPWDVATVMESKSDPKMISLYISRETVTGTVEELSDEDGIKINGKFYQLSSDYVGSKIELGMGAIFYLDFNGKIVTFKRDASASLGEYAVLMGISYDEEDRRAPFDVQIYTTEGKLIVRSLRNAVNVDGASYKVSSDLQKIAEKLSGGAKNDSGKYYIEEPFVIRVVISDGEITNVDTGKSGKEGNLQRVAYGTKDLLHRSNGLIRVLDADGTYIHTYFEPNNALIFCTPDEESLDDDTQYQILKTLPNSRIYKKFESNANKQSYHVAVESYSIYNLLTSDNDSGIEVAEVILFNGVTTKSMSGSSATGLKVVTKITKAVDENGKEAARLYMNEGTKELVASQFTIDNGDEKINVSNINDYIKPGMIIVTTKDKNDMVDNINIIATYDEKANVLTGSSKWIVATEMIDRNDNSPYYNKGTVMYADAEKQIIRVDDGTYKQLMPISGDLYIYRPEVNKVFSGSVMDIAEGDEIIINATDFFNIKSVIIYKK